MPIQVQFRRGTTAQNNSFTGAAGEITVNTSNNTLRVHDGSTAGGFELLSSSSTIGTSQIADSAITTAKIAAGAVVTADIADGNVTSSKLDSNLALSGTVNYLGAPIERANISFSNVTANITFSPYDQAIRYFAANTNANSTVTVNFTGLSNMSSGNVLSATILLTNNATFNAYISAVQVDGSAASGAGVGGTVNVNGTPTGNTIRWQSSAPTSGSANVEVYSFSIFKNTANSYLVLGSKSNFV